MVVIDTHLARGASNGGFTFHDRGGPYGRTKGAKRIVAVDVTGLLAGALAVPAPTHENGTTELMLEHHTEQGVAGRLELVLVDRGVTAAAANALGPPAWPRAAPCRLDDKQPVFRPIRHACASRSPMEASAAPGVWPSRSRTPPPRRPAGSRSPASPPPCATFRELRIPGRTLPAAA